MEQRFENGKELLVAGLSERYNSDNTAGIPAQWQRFGPYIGNIPGQIGRTAYGIISDAGGNGFFDYLCCVEVRDLALVPPDLIRLRISERKYAVFPHRDHISTIRSTFDAIFNRWLPNSECKRAHAPVFERYAEDFEPGTGFGGVEIWVPVR
jgi:AraC family transcriptional regulator